MSKPSTKQSLLLLFLAGLALTLAAIYAQLNTPAPVAKACCSADACARYHHHDVAPSQAAPEFYTDKELTEAYAAYNEKYFDNALPKDTYVQWGEASRPDNMAETARLFEPNGPFVIVLVKTFNPAQKTALSTLLHEMSHVKLWGVPGTMNGKHTAIFEAEITRLQKAGAYKGLL